MTHTYNITGITCSNCESKIKSALLTTPFITGVDISKENNTATITMEKHIAIADLQTAIKKAGDKYRIKAKDHNEAEMQATSWFETYKPVLLIFTYITGVTLLLQAGNNNFGWMQWMRHFMAAFFLVFSFFKMLNLKGFAQSYVMYDVLARRIPAWAYVYAFVELALGIAYLINFNPFITNLVTLIVMLVSIIGVLQTILNKKKIQCACLGAVFNLPMSTITIIEDALMIAMSAWMLTALL